MSQHFKASFIFTGGVIILTSLINPLSAQQVNNTTTIQKTAATVNKRAVPVKAKSTTVVKKTTVTKKKITVVKKPIPVKDSATRSLTLPELKMTARENQMVDEINLVRSDPAEYVKYVKEFLKTSNAEKHTITAANELMDELKRLKPLTALKINMDMYRDAKNYGAVMMANNSIEHSDLPYNENLSFGIEDIREVIIDLLIDEGIPNRGHRKNILMKDISMVAVHELPGSVDDYQYCYVQEFK